MTNEELFQKKGYYLIKIAFFFLNLVCFAVGLSLFLFGLYEFFKHAQNLLTFYHREAVVNILIFGGILVILIGIVFCFMRMGKSDPDEPKLNKYEKKNKRRHPFTYQEFSDNSHFHFMYKIKHPRKFYPETMLIIGVIYYLVGMKYFNYYGINVNLLPVQ